MLNPNKPPQLEPLKADSESAFCVELQSQELPERLLLDLKIALRKAYKEHQRGNTGAVLCQVFLTPADGDEPETICIKGQFFPYCDAMNIYQQLKEQSP